MRRHCLSSRRVGPWAIEPNGFLPFALCSGESLLPRLGGIKGSYCAFSLLETVSGRSHKEAWTGCVVSLTTSTRSY
jgi:hypothetical protein